MPARFTMGMWLDENPKAREAIEVWMAERGAGVADRGLPGLSIMLTLEYGYPFGPPGGGPDANIRIKLRTFMPEAWAIGEGEAAPAATPERKPSLAQISHARPAEQARALETHGTFVVTCAQNNTPVDAAFLKALELYANERDAKLLVIPIRYINPTSRRDPQDTHDEDYWWDEKLTRYLIQNELHVHPRVRIMGATPIQATSPQPLAGLDSRSQDCSAVYGHPQLMFKTVATPHQQHAKLLYTTGAVTQRNYSNTKAGDLGNFHHSNSAIVIETDGDWYTMREISWSGGDQSFHDQERRYTEYGSSQAPPIAALITGDEHAVFHCPQVRLATYDDPDAIVKVLRPEYIVRHDVLDCYAINWHHRNNTIVKALKAQSGMNDMRRELDLTLRFIEATTPEGAKNILVFSNHNHQLTRWLESGETGVESINETIYHWLKCRVLERGKMTPAGAVYPDAFSIYAEKFSLLPLRFIGAEESFRVKDIELGMHGHLGPNGARGTARNLSTVGARSVIGHSHSPTIYQGVYQTGTSTYLRLDYNAGPSSWLNTHVIIHANGKRQMVHIIGGRWRR